MVKSLKDLILPKKNIENNIQGIIWFILAALCFSIMASFIRHTSDLGVHPFVIVLFRNIFGLCIMLPWIIKIGYRNIKTTQFSLHITRNISGIIGMSLFFYSLSVLPITEAISLSFTVPLFTTIAAMIMLNEKVTSSQWTALAIGFIGILVILRPGLENTFNYYGLIMILATICWSYSNIIIKKLTANDSTYIIVFYMTLIMIPLSLPLAIPVFSMPNTEQLFWLFCVGLSSIISHICITTAYAKADVSTLQPLDFTRLIFISIIAYLAFDEVIDTLTLIGAIIIFSSSVFVTRYTAKKLPIQE